MSFLELAQALCAGLSPVTGDQIRPWLAAVILIVSIVVLVTMILVSRRPEDREDPYQDEDASEEDL